MRVVDPAALDIAALCRPGDTVMWGQADAEPVLLTRALMTQRHRIGGRIRAFVGVSLADSIHPLHADVVDFVSYCGSGANRELARSGKLEVCTLPYSEMARRIARGDLPVDVLLLQLAPPDGDGRYSMSLAHEYLVPALEHARVVVAEINEQAPWTYGERYLTDGDIDVAIMTSHAPLDSPRSAPDAVALAIARNAAALVDDGSTLQIGLGTLPGLVLAQLRDRHDLGIHSGAIGDAVADLAELGCITNARKSIDPGVTVAGIMMGTARVHAFAHGNAAVQFRSSCYTHDAGVLARIERFVAINSALEVDLTGQINSEVANGVYVGAVGGAPDFLGGARNSRGGLPLVVLPSTSGARSRIVAALNGPVTIPGDNEAVVVTEHGVADLRGLSARARAQKLIDIAHPDWRERLAESIPLH